MWRQDNLMERNSWLTNWMSILQMEEPEKQGAEVFWTRMQCQLMAEIGLEFTCSRWNPILHPPLIQNPFPITLKWAVNILPAQTPGRSFSTLHYLPMSQKRGISTLDSSCYFMHSYTDLVMHGSWVVFSPCCHWLHPLWTRNSASQLYSLSMFP